MDKEEKDDIDEVLGIKDKPSQPEAPISSTVRGYYKGYSVLLTKRDPNVKSLPLLEDAMKAIDWMDEHGFKPSWADDTNKKNGQQTLPAEPTKSFVCQTCGSDAEYKQGVSKTGKPWKAVFCNETKSHVQWV